MTGIPRFRNVVRVEYSEGRSATTSDREDRVEAGNRDRGAALQRKNGGGADKTLVHALIAGGVALVVLLVAFWFWMTAADRAHQIPGAALSVPASDMRLVEGRGGQEGSGLRLEGPGPHGRAVLLSRIPDDAPDLARLQTLEIPIEFRKEVPSAALVWVNTADPETEHVETVDPASSIDLSALDGWNGDPALLGLVLQGRQVAGTYIEGLEFRGPEPSPVEALRALLQGWVEPVPFSNVTPHVVRAGSRDVPFTPSSVAAIWTLLAVGIFVLIHRWRGGCMTAAGVVGLVLFAWVVMDLRWQADLLHEHRNTFEAYAGVPDIERVPDDFGGEELGRLVAAARQRLEPDARVFTLSGNDGLTRYVRYRLLPLAGFFGAELTPEILRYARAGDGVILLAPHDVTPLRLRRGLPESAKARFPWSAEADIWNSGSGNMRKTPEGKLFEYSGQGDARIDAEIPLSLPSAFYRVVVSLDVPEPGGALRLQVRRADDAEGLIAQRVIAPRELAAGPREFALGFGMPARGRIEVRVDGLSAGGRLGDLRLEYPEDADQWVALARDGRPPLRAARVLERTERDLLLELQ